ncbi:MAG: M15 family metallopeptidase [Myxococcota bacterium]
MYTRRVLPKSHAAIRRQLATMAKRIRSGDELERGDRGAAVKALESHLKAAGLFNGKADSTFDWKTRDAVEKLQKAKRLPVTGVVDKDTLAQVRKLDVFVRNGFKPAAHEGQVGADIQRAEKLLKKAGFNPGKRDGRFTQMTEKAVRRFQKAYGLKRSGDLTAGTAKVLKQITKSKPALGYINGVPRHIRVTSVGDGEYLRTDAARAFLRMKAAAKRAGVSLSATSGFRTMAEQKYLYNLYLSGRGNLAARPGYSNHQGGIAMDIGGVGGYGTRAYRWLSHHARRFGFVNDVRGEYWHWTYRR